MIEFYVMGIKLEELTDIQDRDDEGQEVDVVFNSEYLLTLTYDEAVEMSEMSDTDLERGAEYCREIHCCFDSWQAARENFRMDNTDKEKIAYIDELFTLPDNLKNYFDYESYWDNEARHGFAETDNYIFYA